MLSFELWIRWILRLASESYCKAMRQSKRSTTAVMSVDIDVQVICEIQGFRTPEARVCAGK